MRVRVKRVYETPAEEDGTRILVDRLWPRGVSKEDAALDDWMRDIAPSDELREWFDHDPERWKEFERRYRAELEEKEDLIEGLREYARDGQLTLVYAAKDQEHNNARVLQEVMGGALNGE